MCWLGEIESRFLAYVRLAGIGSFRFGACISRSFLHWQPQSELKREMALIRANGYTDSWNREMLFFWHLLDFLIYIPGEHLRPQRIVDMGRSGRGMLKVLLQNLPHSRLCWFRTVLYVWNTQMSNPILQDVIPAPAPATRNPSRPIEQHPKRHQQSRSAGVRVHRQRRRRFAQVWNARWRHGSWSIDLRQGCRWLGYLKSCWVSFHN